MADLNGDGRLDLISGSWDGEISLFPGTQEGFGKKQLLKHVDGKVVKPNSATAVAVADWDGDGDQDLIIGVISGPVVYAENKGSKTEPRFAPTRPMMAGGARIQANDGGPCVADWDGDGTMDLIVGDGEGRVRWYRGKAGDNGPLALEAGQDLIAGTSYQSQDTTRSGVRAKPAVVDWNGDGKLDLLVGDFQMRRVPPPKLTPAQQVEQRRLQQSRNEVMTRLRKRSKAVDTAVRKSLGIKETGTVPQAKMREYNRVYSQKVVADSEYQKIMKEYGAISSRILEERYDYSGKVWVYLRT